jgi:hypothetical protein
MVPGVTGGQHLAHDLVDREAVLFRAAGTGVARYATARATKGRHVAAADPGGEEAQQHLALG